MRSTENGRPVEITDDWYAQDRCGNVWYLGEATKEYENGKVVSTEGSFEAGVDGAEPGIVMPAKPTVGLTYRQEHYVGHAEDRAQIASRKEWVEVPYRYFGPGRVLMTRELNPLHPKVLELKFYARGVGPVLADRHLGWKRSRGARELRERKREVALIAISSRPSITEGKRAKGAGA